MMIKMKLLMTLSMVFFVLSNAYGEVKTVPQVITETKIFKKVDNILGKEKNKFVAEITVEGKIPKKSKGVFKGLDGEKYEIYAKINKKKSKTLLVTPNKEFENIFYIDGLKFNENDRLHFVIYHDDLVKDKVIYEKEFLLDDDEFNFEFKTLEVNIALKESE